MVKKNPFDTGNNLPLGKKALRRTIKWLDKKLHRRFLVLRGLPGGYAKVVQIDGQRMYLVARGSGPMYFENMPYVSITKKIVDMAAQKKIPIVLGVIKDVVELPMIYLVNPLTIQSHHQQINPRLDEKMYNFKEAFLTEWNILE